ncbi:MAG: glutamate racemase [Spirochaetaceae bacterium]|jgi:glutamate racemase|nr:glutamate racemase [Spirochaetaceae bacterium]
MNKKPIVFLDSGVGGLPYYSEFTRRNPHREAVYIADRKNFPYGKKSKNELVDLLVHIIAALVERINPVMVVLVCNTASVSALDELRTLFSGIMFVGTVPAVRPAALNSKTGIIGVLGTKRTIEDKYIDRIIREIERPCKIIRSAAPELVDFIEHNYFTSSPAEKRAVVNQWTERIRSHRADGLVLGCTHFLFLLNEFKQAAQPDITIYDSLNGVCSNAERLLLDARFSDAPENPEHSLLVTGGKQNLDIWEKWARAFKLNLCDFDGYLSKQDL